ncbi:MAG: hypothetical protein WDN04_19780 [Rhodospirillales bacterium]
MPKAAVKSMPAACAAARFTVMSTLGSECTAITQRPDRTRLSVAEMLSKPVRLGIPEAGILGARRQDDGDIAGAVAERLGIDLFRCQHTAAGGQPVAEQRHDARGIRF